MQNFRAEIHTTNYGEFGILDKIIGYYEKEVFVAEPYEHPHLIIQKEINKKKYHHKHFKPKQHSNNGTANYASELMLMQYNSSSAAAALAPAGRVLRQWQTIGTIITFVIFISVKGLWFV